MIGLTSIDIADEIPIAAGHLNGGNAYSYYTYGREKG